MTTRTERHDRPASPAFRPLPALLYSRRYRARAGVLDDLFKGIPFGGIHWIPPIRFADRGLPLRGRPTQSTGRNRIEAFCLAAHE